MQLQQASTPPGPRGRFAPTPSGSMHVGNALAALLAWLQIRKLGGTFILRIEDIDTARSRPYYTEQLIRELKWLGLDWDEGPEEGGPAGPYIQSERLRLYEEALQVLMTKDLLFPCYCSRADILSAASAPHGLSSEGPVYPGTCRGLTAEERIHKGKHKQPSLRFKTPDRIIAFHDGIAGLIRMKTGDGGDFIVKRADGMFSYQLAVVVDDAMMGVTDILRGADLLDSTPRQLLLYEALGWTAPHFAHFPLLVNEDGRRLAKRSQGLSLSDLRRAGVSPERITGWLAYASGLLGKPESCRPAELISHFDLAAITKSPIVLNDAMLGLLTRP